MASSLGAHGSYTHSDLQNFIIKPRSKNSTLANSYVPERSEDGQGILYRKLRDEDVHVYRVLSDEDLAKEAKEAEAVASSLREAQTRGRPRKAWNAPNKSSEEGPPHTGERKYSRSTSSPRLTSPYRTSGHGASVLSFDPPSRSARSPPLSARDHSPRGQSLSARDLSPQVATLSSRGAGPREELEKQVARLQRMVLEQSKRQGHAKGPQASPVLDEGFVHQIEQLKQKYDRNVEVLKQMVSSAKRAASSHSPTPSSARKGSARDLYGPTGGGGLDNQAGGDECLPPQSARSASAASGRSSRAHSSRKRSATASVAGSQSCVQRMQDYIAKRRAREQAALEAQRAEEQREKEAEHKKRQAALNARPFNRLLEHERAMEERKKERRVRVEVEEEKEMQQAHFKAKPVVLKGDDWATMQARAEVERKARVEARAVTIQAMASLPNRMRIHQLEKAASQASISANSKSASVAAPEVVEPKKKLSIAPEKIRAVLEKRQRRWEEAIKEKKRELLAKKQVEASSSEGTGLYERQSEYVRKANERAERKRRKEEEGEAKRRQEEEKQKERILKLKNPPPRTTAASEKQVQRTQAKLEARRREEEAEKKGAEERAAREREAAAVLRPVLRAEDEKAGRQPGGSSHVTSDKPPSVQAILKQNRAKLEEKLRSRPTLLERHSRTLQADDAKRAGIAAVARIIYSMEPNKKGDDWRNKARRGDILDDEEKAYLGVGAGGGGGGDDYDDDFGI